MENGLKRKPHNCRVSLRNTQAESWGGDSMGTEYDRAVEVLAERYGLVMLCEENGVIGRKVCLQLNPNRIGTGRHCANRSS